MSDEAKLGCALWLVVICLWGVWVAVQLGWI